MHATPRRRGGRRWLILMISLLLTLCISIGLAIAFTPAVVRYVFISRLDDPDDNVRMTGMVFVCRHAADDPAVFDAAAKLLADEATDARTADGIVRALRCAEVWGPRVGRGWVRWLEQRLADGDASLRTAAALKIARAGLDREAVMADARLHALIKRLAADEDPGVRYAALKAAVATPVGGQVVQQLQADDHATVARLASIISAVQSGAPLPVLPAAGPNVRRWRSLLEPGQSTETLLEAYRDPPPGEQADVIAAAAASRLAPHFNDNPQVQAALEPVQWLGVEDRFFRELAVLENLPTGSVEFDMAQEMPGLVRAAAVRVARHVSEDDWLNAFDSEYAGVRHLAALAAMERLDRETLNTLARKLSRTFYDNERMGSAMLIGLAGLDARTLRDRLKRESVWVVKQHVRLGLLMIGEPIDVDFDALLLRSDMPRQSVIVAMLHTGRIEGFDQLLRPLSGDGGALRDELDRLRFWPMLKRYLPPDAPRFDTWADPATQQLQCDALRAWYLVNRSRLTFDAASRRFMLD